MRYKGIKTPSDFFNLSYTEKLKINDMLVYSILATSSDWCFENCIKANEQEISVYLNLPQKTIKRSVDKLIKAGLISRPTSLLFCLIDYHDCGLPKVAGVAHE